jgi:hypothetical protein
MYKTPRGSHGQKEPELVLSFYIPTGTKEYSPVVMKGAVMGIVPCPYQAVRWQKEPK